MKFLNVFAGSLAVASATVQSESNTGLGLRGGPRKLQGPVCSVTSEDVTDTEIRSNMINEDRGSMSSITVDQSDGGVVQGLIKVNTFNIPAGKGLASAKLIFYTNNGSSGTISGHRMKLSWSDSSSWSSFGLDGTQGIQLGSEANTAPSFVFTGPSHGHFVEFDVTDDVKFWLSGGLNEGWMLQNDSGDGWDFHSANNSNRPPVLELTYFDDGECPRQIYDCKASAWGDPHIVTFDGLKFDAQPKGEAIFLTDSASALQVQARLVALGTRGGVPAVIEGVAVQGYDEDSPIIEVSVGDGPATIIGCSVDLIVTGDKQAGLSYRSENAIVSTEGKDITIEYEELRIDMSTKNRGGKCYFSIDVTLFDCGLVKDTVIGILGSPNDDPYDDWMDRNGTSIPIPRGASSFFFEPAFDYCKENWIIEDEEESLFDYTGPTTFADVSVPDEEFDNEYQRAVEEADEALVEVCGDDIGCLVDGVGLGEDAAEEYLENPACVRSVIVPDDPPTSSPVAPTSSPVAPTSSPVAPTSSPVAPTSSPTEEDDLICPE